MPLMHTQQNTKLPNPPFNGYRYYVSSASPWSDFPEWIRKHRTSGIRNYVEIYLECSDLTRLEDACFQDFHEFSFRFFVYSDSTPTLKKLEAYRDFLFDHPLLKSQITIQLDPKHRPSLLELDSFWELGIYPDISIICDSPNTRIDDLDFLSQDTNQYNSTTYFEANENLTGWFSDQRYLDNKSDYSSIDVLTRENDVTRFNALVLTLTDNCNMSCRHCAPECEPNKNRVDVDLFKKAIREASTNPYIRKEVSFVGGEPTIFFDELISLVRYATNHGFSPCMTTNGWWGKSKKKRTKMFEQLTEAGMNRMELSVDVFHQEFLDIEAIRSILIDAKKFGVSIILRCVVFKDGDIRECLKGLTLGDMAGHLVASSPVLPFGRALSAIPMEDFFWSDRKDGNCDKSLNFTVRYDGVTTPCCVGTEFVDFMHIGNSRDESISDLVDNFRFSPKFNRLTKEGPKKVLEDIGSETSNSLLSKTCVGMCDLCILAMGNNTIQDEFVLRNKDIMRSVLKPYRESVPNLNHGSNP